MINSPFLLYISTKIVIHHVDNVSGSAFVLYFYLHIWYIRSWETSFTTAATRWMRNKTKQKIKKRKLATNWIWWCCLRATIRLQQFLHAPRNVQSNWSNACDDHYSTLYYRHIFRIVNLNRKQKWEFYYAQKIPCHRQAPWRMAQQEMTESLLFNKRKSFRSFYCVFANLQSTDG